MFEKEAEIFVREGKVAVPFLSSDVVPLLIPGLLTFFALPEKAKMHLAVDTPDEDDPDKGPDNGYIRKSGGPKKDGGLYDRKQIFHYRPSLWSEYAKRDVDITPYRAWLGEAHTLYLRCLQLLKNFTRALDKECPGYNFQRLTRTERALSKHVLRALLYDPPSPGEILIGKSHTDRNGISIHVRESRPGLRLGKDQQNYVITPDTALIFPADQVERLTEGKIKALQHEIWEEEPHAPDRRWSLVFFGQTPPLS